MSWGYLYNGNIRILFAIWLTCIVGPQLPFLTCIFMVYRTVGEQISEETFVIGSLERVWDTCHSRQSLLTVKEREIIGAASKIWVFGRARINDAEYQSSFYKRTKARNNFTVYERRGKSLYGSIEKFVKYQEKCTAMSCLNSRCSCDLPFHYIVLLKKMRKHPSQLPMYKGIEVIKHIRRVIVADNPIAVPFTCIKAKCMTIDVDTASVYVCHLPNCFEKDWGMENLYCNNFYWVSGLWHLFHPGYVFMCNCKQWLL